MKGKNVKPFLAGVLCTVLVGGIGLLGYVKLSEKNHAVTLEAVQKARKIEKLIDTYYLEETDKETLEAYMYKGLTAGLGDPYSAYYTSDEYGKLSESIEGVYKGIGVTMQQDPSTGVVTVVKCFEGAPGEKAGMQPGDRLYKVNGEVIQDKELTEIVKMIKTSENDTAVLTIAREGDQDYREMQIPLEEVEVPVVESKMLEDEIGYIVINEFTEVAVSQYAHALSELKEQGMGRLIVDVRGNPGGLLYSVCQILDQMLPEELLVYTEDKNGKKKEYMASGEDAFDMPMAILVNGNSASASEIFAGALQDYEIAKLVGTTTFGKGIVQQTFSMDDGSALKLTISKYYTPKGRCIHGTGLEPDVEVELDEHLKNQAVIEEKEDNQLQKAIQVVKAME
ncbi:MAG: S41 family peptidase [Blautia sp.]